MNRFHKPASIIASCVPDYTFSGGPHWIHKAKRYHKPASVLTPPTPGYTFPGGPHWEKLDRPFHKPASVAALCAEQHSVLSSTLC